jgi:copper resistance protein B
MSALRIASFAAALAVLATAAAAQIPAAPDQPQPQVMPGMLPGALEPTVMDTMVFAHGILDQFEGRTDGRVPQLRWSGEGWVGTDYDKFWLKTEGRLEKDGKVEDGQHEFLYSRAVTTFFDLQVGLRSDLDSSRTRNWAAFGFEGLAPLFFHVAGTGYVGSQGRLAARFEGSYDLLLTQRLILQPQIEVELYSKSDPGRGVGAGLSEIDTGLRLRYEITRKFAPYIGVAYEGKFGQTASLARRAGESTSGVKFVFGVRSWF